jgi:hypothetical protein
MPYSSPISCTPDFLTSGQLAATACRAAAILITVIFGQFFNQACIAGTRPAVPKPLVPLARHQP